MCFTRIGFTTPDGVDFVEDAGFALGSGPAGEARTKRNPEPLSDLLLLLLEPCCRCGDEVPQDRSRKTTAAVSARKISLARSRAQPADLHD
jgi:hypothetical protein